MFERLPLFIAEQISGPVGSLCHVYLPPDRADIPAFTPAEAGTRLSDPGGMQG